MRKEVLQRLLAFGTIVLRFAAGKVLRWRAPHWRRFSDGSLQAGISMFERINTAKLETACNGFHAAKPFPHMVIDGFFSEDLNAGLEGMRQKSAPRFPSND